MTTHTLDLTKTTDRTVGRKHVPTRSAVDTEETTVAVSTGHWLAATRFAVGFIFLWAFLDKTFGLGYGTASAKAWIHGGSPTKGFLSGVAAGPFANTFHSIAGNVAVDWLFMLGLLGIGVATIAGVALRPAAVAGTLMMAMMWAAEWPMAKFGAQGPTASNNPIVDYHIVYALALIVLASLSAGRSWGLGARWARLPVVRDHRNLR
jgi:thiosulfate dehydrogenase [quinone] large subunit